MGGGDSSYQGCGYSAWAWKRHKCVVKIVSSLQVPHLETRSHEGYSPPSRFLLEDLRPWHEVGNASLRGHLVKTCALAHHMN